MQTTKEREADAARALFLDKAMPAHLLIEFADRGESLVQGLAAWPDDDWNFTTIGAVFGDHQPAKASDPVVKAMGQQENRDSAEADAARTLFLYFGASAKILIKNAERGCSFQRTKIQQGRILLIPSDKPISLTSPLAIQMLLHFYAQRDRFIPAPVSTWPPAQRAIVEAFMHKGLIYDKGYEDYTTTDKGEALVATLKAAMTEGLKNV